MSSCLKLDHIYWDRSNVGWIVSYGFVDDLSEELLRLMALDFVVLIHSVWQLLKCIFLIFQGTAIGRGVYFARDAQYSVGYAKGGVGGRYMYLARVLVGQYCVGNSAMIVPPPKNPSKPEILHDSVVNRMGNPSMFVVFFDNQCYPEYLITF